MNTKMEQNKVLIVEDEISIAKMIAMNLKVAGYETKMFHDGREAAEALEEEHAYDIALLDVMLPGMDGFNLFEIVRTYEIPVIFLTAKDDINSKIQGLQGGAEDYIVKPFEMVELIARVEAVLRRVKKDDDFFEFKNIKIDFSKQTATDDLIEGRWVTIREVLHYDLIPNFIPTMQGFVEFYFDTKGKGLSVFEAEIEPPISTSEYTGESLSKHL